MVSLQYSWEAGGRGGRYSVMSNVWNKSQGPVICLSCHLNVLHGHGNVTDSCCGSIFPPGKQRLLLFVLCFCYTVDYMKLPGKFQDRKLMCGSYGKKC